MIRHSGWFVAAIAMLFGAVCAWMVRPTIADPSPNPNPGADVDPLPNPDATRLASGFVFHDANGNGMRDEGEAGIAGVCVSNQLEVTVTDENGRWSLPVGDADAFFVVKPRNYMVPVDANNLPRFHYLHVPNGSPAQRFPGVAATGPLPGEIDFPLVPRVEPDEFTVIFFADPQPRNITEVNYITRDVVEELVGTDAAFGVTLGDIVFDDLSVFAPLNAAIGKIGVPWFNVIGNHDINYDSPDDEHSDETYEATYGPNYYSFDWGPVHFVALDNVYWSGRREGQRGRYIGRLGERQLAWLRNDLARVPNDRLVVVMMHIPLLSLTRGTSTTVSDRRELYRILEGRPHVASFSGHMHFQHQQFIGASDGWKGEKPLMHLQAATVCGSWWAGTADERGIPHATMMCGAPNGYSIAHFTATGVTMTFKAASRPADYQMAIHAPDEIGVAELASVKVVVNVFGGSEKSSVEMRVCRDVPANENAVVVRDWAALRWQFDVDPQYAKLFAEQGMPTPVPSPHLWNGGLPADLPPGTYRIDVRTTDCFGQTFTGYRIVRITAGE